MEEGQCVILSAPSGAGKTTIAHHLLTLGLGLEFSISAASREKRETEVDGKDYHFFSVEDFKKKVKEDAFIEWEEVYPNHLYGTLRTEVHRIWSVGKVGIFDVDVKGGLKLKKIFGEQALAIFIVATMEELEQRLRGRQTDSEERIALRLEKAEEEVLKAGQFDKVIINDNLAHAKRDAEIIVREFVNL